MVTYFSPIDNPFHGVYNDNNEDKRGISTVYIYEMHQHTAVASACAYETPEEVVRGLKKKGFSGVVLTDHFYHGNTAVRRHQAWEDFVRPYEEAYERACREAEKWDFDVLFGIEEGVGGGKEVLVYGITPAFLYEHPELRDARLPEWSALVRAAGGLLVQAHPFRVRDYIPAPWEELPTEHLDGVEVHNACNDDLSNTRAQILAEKHDLLAIAGSDAHTTSSLGRAGIVCETRIRTERELATILRDGAYEWYVE